MHNLDTTFTYMYMCTQTCHDLQLCLQYREWAQNNVTSTVHNNNTILGQKNATIYKHLD